MLEAYLPPIPDDAVPTGERGELGERLVATLIDFVPSIVICIAFFILQFVLAFIPFLGCILGCGLWLIQVAIHLAYIFYFIPMCVSKNGASIGKKMQKLRVVPLGEPAGRLTMSSAAIRQIGYILGVINLIVLAVKGEERISLADMLGKSEVIKVDR